MHIYANKNGSKVIENLSMDMPVRLKKTSTKVKLRSHVLESNIKKKEEDSPPREEREVCFRFLSREGEVYETAPPTFRIQLNERPCRFFIVSILIALKNIRSPFPLC